MPLFLLTAVLSFLLSLAAAFLANEQLTERISLMGEYIGLTLSHNPGIAFGLRLPSGLQELLILAALIMICIVAWRSLHNRTDNLNMHTHGRVRLDAIGFGLIVGGAVGNIIDRIGDGLVTDFIQVGTFPVFNVADSCITIGVAFVLAEMIQVSRRDHRPR